jgi:hypothetical protein
MERIKNDEEAKKKQINGSMEESESCCQERDLKSNGWGANHPVCLVQTFLYDDLTAFPAKSPFVQELSL